MTYRKPWLVPLLLFLILPVRPAQGTNLEASGEKVAVGQGWAIRLPASPHRALIRAARDLQIFFRERHHLDLKIEEGLQTPGIFLVVENSAQDDRFSSSCRVPRRAG